MAENTQAAPAPKKSKLKLIILVVVVVALAIGLSVAGTLWFLQGAEEGGSTADQPETEVFQASQYYVMAKPLVAALQTDGRQRYAQVHLAFSARDTESLTALEKHLPLVRSQLLAVLGAQKFEELQTPEGRDRLISELLTAVNQVLEAEAEQPIEQILFRNFVLQ
ncbi:flagellar basal body-associated FliL family protein [Marinobacter salicampi]|uniref:flagellar basal body-associated FliL family protein n=1 Tax=Marinobacter salicampi TaxID=435907 RepID=UPI00140E5B51|nr:flagellar basal body-associated FliL family protein [Marinobacter salicampi]